MDSEYIRNWQAYLIQRHRPGSAMDAKYANESIQTAIASLESAYQTALLREMLEKKIINILPDREITGRLFKE